MGGHGGLNILPQKTWNVYRNDNRAKVEEDEELLNEAKEKWAQNQRSEGLKAKIGELKHANGVEKVFSGDIHQLTDQELYKLAKKDKKRKEKEKKKELQEMLENPEVTGEDGHINLFMAEEYENKEKNKLTKDQVDKSFLTKTANLGELLNKNNGPWYSNKNKQMKNIEEIEMKAAHQKADISQTKQKLRIARINPMREFGQVLDIEGGSSKSLRHDDSDSKEKKHKKHKSSKKHKKEKKSKKSSKEKKVKKMLKYEKLRELEALIDYQNRYK